MSVKPKVEVNVEQLVSDAIDEHLRLSTAVLHEMLRDEGNANFSLVDTKTEPGTARVAVRNLPAADDKDHICRHCGKLYKTGSTLQMHLRLKHPSEPGDRVEVRCMSCDKTYASLLSLQKHQRYMHRYPHRCKACYRTFETQNLLAEHGSTCVKSERPCPTCGKIYDSQLALRNHVKYKHPEVKNNWCGICRRAFTTDRGLTNHRAIIHPGGIACGSCDKTFTSVAALQSHVLYKHSENGHRCTQCRKVFASHGSLSRHLAKNHNVVVYDGGKYCCGVCEARFQGSSDLIKHVMDEHTGVKVANDNEDVEVKVEETILIE